MMSPERFPVVVLGLGNVICADDGAGVVAVHRLMRDYVVPPRVQAFDGGTLGGSLLPIVESAGVLLLIDAIRSDAPSGTLLRITGSDVGAAVYERLSPHQIGVADLLAGATLIGRYPEQVILWGIVPATTALGCARTPAVENQIPALVDAVVAELEVLGYPARARNKAATRNEEGMSDGSVARALGL